MGSPSFLGWLPAACLVACSGCGGGSHHAPADVAGADAPGDAAPSDAWLGVPPCPSGPLLDMMPVAPANIAAIAPLGTLGPPAHTLAVDHTYIAGKNSAATTSAIEVQFPTSGWIPQAARYSYTNGLVEYRFLLQPCREFVVKLDHVATGSPALVAALGSFDPSPQTVCTAITAPDGTPGTWCEKGFTAPGPHVTSGDLAGSKMYTPNQILPMIDLGAFDARIPPIAYANPARYGTSPDGFDAFHVACPYDYLPSTLHDQVLALMGDAYAMPIEYRTVDPRCGTVEVDVASTAQGSWFLDPVQLPPPIPDETRAIVLAHDHVDPTRGELSIGATSTNVGVSAYYFTPLATGSVNREFSAITPGAGVFCYEQLTDRTNHANGSGIVLVGLDDATTLRIERQTASSSCGAGPWSFTAAATTFIR